MTQTTYHVICFGTLDAEDGTTYSQPFTYDDRTEAEYRFGYFNKGDRHEAVFLVAETGDSFTVVKCSSGDRAHLVKDGPGAFALLSSGVLA
jgi:hypothetical protein